MILDKWSVAVMLASCYAGMGCGGSAQLDTESGLSGSVMSQPSALDPEQEAADQGSGGRRCDASAANREATEYDTSGDGKPDVRKVYLRIGEGDGKRLVMICRETDLNADARKDVIRYYNDQGESVRENADRNFDGRIDISSAYEKNRLVYQEVDRNFDGGIDARLYYEDAKLVRIERDLAGRSSPGSFRADRWEYYDAGQLTRMGTDLSGDGKVDRWDRDQATARVEAPSDGIPED